MKRLFLGLVLCSLFLLIIVPVVAAPYQFTRNLTKGMQGPDVTMLQQFLTDQGVYTGPITGAFYNLTMRGVAAFQSKEHIQPASGYFGPLTRTRANEILAAATTTPESASVLGASAISKTTTKTRTVKATTTQPTTTAVLPPSTKGILWGAYAGDTASDLSKLETLVGAAANMQAIFSPWTDPFPSQFASALCPANKTLVIFWENYNFSLDDIIAGKYDSYIKSFSTSAQNYKCPVIISLFHEMNGNWDDWDGTVGNNSPAKIIAAWKHVHDLVTATNVKWAWTVNNESVPDTSNNQIASYYPGSAYVDYVAIDGFNFGNPWQSFTEVFGRALSQVKIYNKPIYILSMASTAGSQKGAWITDALAVQMARNGIAGWIWFNQNKELNWTINSDSAALTAFKAAVAR